MYSPQGVSPYYDMSTENTAVFLSAGDFYIDTGSHYTSLVNGNSIEKSELPSDVISNSAELLDNGEDFSTIRQMYIDGTFPNDNLRSELAMDIRLRPNLHGHDYQLSLWGKQVVYLIRSC